MLEARDRVGGRMHSGNLAGATVDLGATWLTAGQTRLAALASELDVATYEHVRSGTPILDESAGWFAKLSAAFAQRKATKAIEALMEAPLASAHDATTLAAWLATNIESELARERIRLHSDLVFAVEAEDLSLLSYLTTMRATGGFRPGGDDLREHRFDGGAAMLASRLAEGLDVRISEAVLAVEDAHDAVRVRTERTTHAARFAVLAIPPPLVGRIAMTMPGPQQAYASGVRMGSVVKAFAAYRRPFWRDRGFSGEVYQLVGEGAIRAIVEVAGEPPALCAFIVGRHAARWRERHVDERKADVLATFAHYFGVEEPLAYLEHDWSSDPWSAGCVASTPPGVLAAGARWREPIGRVHIAGTESASTWPGYMDGAIEAGERAAAEILAR